MNTFAALRSALRALAANKLRSVLTMLGIIIGVAAVIAMIAIGQGATDRVHEQMKGLGTNFMLVLPGAVTQGGVRLGAQTGQGLTDDDALAIASEVPGSAGDCAYGSGGHAVRGRQHQLGHDGDRHYQ